MNAFCLNADFRYADGVHTIVLDEAGMQAVAYTIAPEAENLGIKLKSGSIQVVLANGAVDQVFISCEGALNIIITDVSVVITAGMDFRKDAPKYSVPENVLDALNLAA